MLQGLGIRGKLLGVVAVPTVLLLLAASFVVFSASTTYTAGRNTSQLVDVVRSGSALVEQVQAERATVSNYLRAVIDGDNKTSAARAAVNSSVATISAAGENDPAYAAVAQAVVAAVNGTAGAEGLDAYRQITEVPAAQDDFPAWPEPDAVAAATAGFERIGAEVDAVAAGAPVSDTGSVFRQLGNLIRAEADETATYLNEAKQYSDALPTTFLAVDRTGDAFLATSSGVADRPDNSSVLSFIDALRTRLANIDGLRGQIRVRNILPGDAESAYAAMVSAVFQLTREVADTAANRQLAAYLGAYESMNELFEAVRLEEQYVARKIRQGQWTLGEPAVFQGLYFGTNNALANAQLAVAGLPGVPEVPSFGVSYDVNERTGFQTVRDRLLADSSDAALLDQRSAQWEVQVGEELDALAPIRADILDQVQQVASDSVRTSLIQLLATIAIAAIVFVLTLLVTLTMARRIVNPLRRLTTTATAVRQELPRLVERVALPGHSVDVSEVQIPVESRDEVGRLAEAFNSVNAATLSIAAEQAALRGSISEMFVNVARRDQVLLNRQLSSIDEMERTEDNQTTLTKLFALDHLATRMRRNSESLLVLAGIDTGRRLRRPMPLSDVIRTASSEIELYERIQLELDADPSMLGHAALTAAHLFAELLENATVFSDPGAPVVVRTMTDGDDVVVEIQDSGIGMTPEELAEANSRVASTAASEILGAQRLGLFVVGRIARRVGARVQLESVAGEGTVARIAMPSSLFDANAAPSQGHQSTTATDKGIHAPAALVHHSVTDAEVRDALPEEAHRPIASPRDYQPTAIEEGVSLTGRPVEVAVADGAHAADNSQESASPGLDDLVSADAESAPEAVPVDIDALTEGVTPAGLPTRRRKRAEVSPEPRSGAGSETPHDTHSIIGVPMRASDEQLTALQSAATSGFTPILAADEVSPESAEQRARVFRGFRALRDDPDQAPLPSSDAESLDHAVRRGAPDAEAVGQASATDSMPSLEPDVPAPPVAMAAPSAEGAVADHPSDRWGAEPPAPVTEVHAADPRHTEPAVVRQSPLIAAGYAGEDADPSGSALSPALGDGPTPSMAIPMLEEDEPPPAAPAPWSQPDSKPSAGVESVALDDTPYPHDPPPQPPATSEHPAPQSGPVFRSPLYPATPSDAEPQPVAVDGSPGHAGNGWSQGPRDQNHGPRFESDPVTSTPSLDELILDDSHVGESDGRGGFFSRLFGRGRGPQERAESNSPPPADVITPEVDPAAASSSLDHMVATPSEPAAMWQGSVPIPARDENAVPSPSEPRSHEIPAPVPEQRPQDEDTSMWIGRAPAASFNQPAHPAPDYDATREGNAPWETQLPAPSAPPAAWSPTTRPASVDTPAAFSPDPTRNETYDAEWSVAGRSTPTSAAPAPESSGPGVASHAAYSPDQLARPLGWETAGASALQAAAPESATEYRPVVQIEPQQSGEGFADFTSEVFSELSSLAAQRPQVAKTQAGLVKRTPVERSKEPQRSGDVAAPDVPRDAEAVRNRFSSFYSGTQRARDDVKSFNDSTQGSLTEP